MSVNPGRQLGEMFQMIAVAIDNEKDHLSKLDGAIGDGDHGITMSLGFRAVNSAIAKLNADAMTPSEIMAAAAAAFLNAVGASTGPLYATGFRRASKSLEGIGTLDQFGVATMIQAIAEGIADRGKGQRGDKTMLDAWLPAAEAARNANDAHASASMFWKNVVAAADAGAVSTRSMVATKGRAARVGERSLGHMDPGAVSAVIIISEMARAFQA